MRQIIRLVSGLSMLAAIVVLVLDVRIWKVSGDLDLRPLGQLWYQLDRGSLNLVQAVIERHIWPPLWDGLVWVLQLPAVLVFFVIAALLAWATQERHAKPKRTLR